MPTLHLQRLRCIETTGGGADDTYAKITIDGKHHFRWPDRGDVDMDENDVKTINRKYDFDREVKIALWEYDSGSADDYMGGCTIKSSETGSRKKRISNSDEGDQYELEYEVKPSSSRVVIERVQCLAPATGITNWTKGVFGAIGGAIAAGATVAGATVTGGASLTAVGSAVVKGGGAAVKMVELLDDVVSGQDDLYIMVNGEKVWPRGTYHGINKFETVQPNVNKPFHDRVKIELMEYDSGSGDDLLGKLTIDVTKMNQDSLHETFVMGSKDEGSLYEVHLTITK